MENLLYGMGLQALITGFLTSCGLVNPTPGQQVIAGVIFFNFAMVLRFTKNKE